MQVSGRQNDGQNRCRRQTSTDDGIVRSWREDPADQGLIPGSNQLHLLVAGYAAQEADERASLERLPQVGDAPQLLGLVA